MALQTDGESEKKRKSGISHTPMGHITIWKNHRRKTPHPQDSGESPTKLPPLLCQEHHLSWSRRATYKIPYREVVVVVVPTTRSHLREGSR